MRRFRNSQLRLLPQCGYAYKKSYLEGEPGLPSPDLERGIAIHRGISKMVRQVVEGDGLIDVHEIAYQVARGTLANYAEVLTVLIRFQEALGVEIDIDPDRAFLVEETLEMPVEIERGPVATFFGTPDYVARAPRKTCLIEDWKSHWHPDTEEESLADPQLARYALLIDHHFPGFETFVLRKRFVRYRDNWHEREIAKADLDAVLYDLRTEIRIALEREEADDFEATGGGWCGLCAFHASCPLIAEFRETGEDWLSIASDNHASIMAGTALALHAASARLKDQIKTYLGAEHPVGAVAVPGGEYGYGPVSRREVAVDDLRQAFADAGAQMPDDVLRVDLDALDVLRGRLPGDLVRAIDDAIHTYQSSRCAFRRTPRPALNPQTPENENPVDDTAADAAEEGALL